MKRFLEGVFVFVLLLSSGNAYGRMSIKGDVKTSPEIAGAETILEVKPFLEKSDEKSKIAAVRRLKQIGDRNAAGMLAEKFEAESSPYVKQEIIETLGELGGREAKNILFKILTAHLKEGPPGRLDDDYFYLNEVDTASKALYSLYNPKEDREIYNFFKKIALREREEPFILENGKLRVTAYKLYLKEEMSKKDMKKEAAIKEIKKTVKPYEVNFESPGIVSQETIESAAREGFLKDYINNNSAQKILK